MFYIPTADLTLVQDALKKIDDRLSSFFRGATISDIDINSYQKTIGFSVEDRQGDKDFFTMPLEVVQYEESAAELLVREHIKKRDDHRAAVVAAQYKKDEIAQLKQLAKKYPEVLTVS